MPDQYLTLDRFDAWALRIETKLDRVIEKDAIEALKVEARLTTLETYDQQRQSRVVWLAGVVASLVTASITGFVAWLNGWR